MDFKVDNAIIMAAGTSSRFVPISHEKPKALICVKNEVLIERQIRQLHEAGVSTIVVVVGYMKEKFDYLRDLFGVIIIENDKYLVRNNHSSIYAARDYLKNSYICSADNYFSINPFNSVEEFSYYAAVYADGKTKEWCFSTDKEGCVSNVTIGGEASWYMMGHSFWSEVFSENFLKILEHVYDKSETFDKLWEHIYMENLDMLSLKIKKYSSSEIYEFDSLEELREFDSKYVENSGSNIIKKIASNLKCREQDIISLSPQKSKHGLILGFQFTCNELIYCYDYEEGHFERI